MTHPNPKIPAPGSRPSGLSPSATVAERIAALQEIGLSTAEIATAVGVSEATIRNWSESLTEPRDPAARALDDLRTAVVALEEAAIAGHRAASWLTSRNTDPWLHGRRPIEALHEDPFLVLATIEDMILEAKAETESRRVHLRLIDSDDDPADLREPGQPQPSRRRA